MSLEFRTKEELYKRVKPALYSKVEELKRLKINYIKEEDIWNYLIKNVWKYKEDLSLSEMISDILNTNNDTIRNYSLDLIRQSERKIDYGNEELL